MPLSRNVKNIKRFQQIVKALFKVELGYLIQKLHLKDHLTLHERLQKKKFTETKIEPYKLRKVMEELGGTFVKFGQILSLRPDLIPIEYVKEFEKLQDTVPPFSFADVKKTVERELQKPLEKVFVSFTTEPIAAASIAQVHRAKLKTGEQVAVKVMRPSIQETMQKDIEIMQFFAKILEKHGYQFKNFSPTKVVDEFAGWTTRELDFRIEAKNAKIFRHNFHDSKTVYIPQVYDEYSTEKILVLEFLDGVELHDIKAVKKKHIDMVRVVTKGFEAILTQIFEHGFFHADPHPGNILILENTVISFVDFGIVGYFDEKLKRFSLNLFEGIIDNDVDVITKTLLEIGLRDDNALFKLELEELILPLQDAAIKEVKVSEVLENVLGLAHKHNVKFPLDFILFGKTVATLEGIALQYSPQFKMVNSAKSFLRKLIRKRMQPRDMMKRIVKNTVKLKEFVLELPEKTGQLLRGMERADTDIRRIDKDIQDLTMELDRSSNRLSISLIIAALIIASVLTLSYNQYTIYGISALSFVGFLLTGALVLMLLISVLRERRY